MCTKNVERVLDFNHEIKQLYEINLEDDLRYIKSDVGINATGFIYVIGKYDDGDGIKDFEELLEVDIVAPFEKIEDEYNFKICIDDYDYHVLHGDLLLEIVLRIDGLLDENKRKVEETKEFIEIIKDEDSIKNENMDIIEEKIDEFIHIHDNESLTADKLTSIINKVIRDTKEEENENTEVSVKNVDDIEINKEVEYLEEVVDVVDEIPYVEPYIEEPIYREEYTDHILGMREEPQDFLENVLEDSLMDALVDHIADMREVVLLVEDKSECECMDSCDLVNLKEDEQIVKEFNPNFEPNYDHFVFYSNDVKEYELQHKKCELKKESNVIDDVVTSDTNAFNFPLYKEEDELFVFPIFEGGKSMRKEYNLDSFEDMDDYDLEDFMGDLDLLEKEIEELPEITIDKEESKIEEKIVECENEKVKKVDEKESSSINDKLFEDILDDSVNMKISIRYVVIRDGDTYFTLSTKYGVDERVIAKHNKFKVLERGCVIEIPLG